MKKLIGILDVVQFLQLSLLLLVDFRLMSLLLVIPAALLIRDFDFEVWQVQFSFS